MDVNIGYYCNAASTANGPYGYGRTISPNLLAQASGSGTQIVTMTRGTGAIVTYQGSSSTGFNSYSPNVFTTLSQDVINGYWLEATPNGRITGYPLDTSGKVTSVSYIKDPAGPTQTFSYNSAGLLQNLTDAVGRKVTFLYASGLLQAYRTGPDGKLLSHTTRA